MFLKMFKTSDRISVKKIEQPAILKLDAGPQPHKFSGLFKVQTQKDYRGRAQSMPAFKTIEPEAAAAVKPVKAKSKSGLDPKLLAAIDELLINAERLKEVTSVQKSSLPGTPKTPDKPSRTPKEEIAHLTGLIASSNNEHEVAALREKLAAACAAHDKQAQSNVRKGLEESARAGELSLLRGYLSGSARSCRVGANAT